MSPKLPFICNQEFNVITPNIETVERFGNPGNNPHHSRAVSIHDFRVKKRGEYVKLDAYKGHVCIIVNVTTKSGFTNENFKQLNALNEKYCEKGLRILAFPCNQFDEERSSDEDIRAFAAKLGVQFDLFDEVHVNGESADELWKFLKLQLGTDEGKLIKSNFTKYVVTKEGAPVEWFGPAARTRAIVDTLQASCHLCLNVNDFQ